MKIKKFFIECNVLSTTMLLMALALLVSCSDDNENETLAETEFIQLTDTAKDDAVAMEEFSSLTEFVLDEVTYLEMSGKSELQSSENIPSCATISFDEALNQLVIDFGLEGCIGNDGLIRTGTVTVTYTGPFAENGSNLEVVLDNYSVEGVSIAGSKTITNQTETVGMRSFNVVVENASITGPEGGTRTWSSDYTVTRIAGADTPRPYDNVYETVGSASGVNRHGQAFTRTITIPLIKDRKRGCLRNYISGEIQLQNEALSSDVSLNFGDGTCDRIATLTFNGRTREVFLR